MARVLKLSELWRTKQIECVLERNRSKDFWTWSKNELKDEPLYG